MKIIIYYDPETGELLDLPWNKDKPPPFFVKPKIKKAKKRKPADGHKKNR